MKSLIVLVVAVAMSSPAMAAKKKHVHLPKQKVAQQCVYPYQQSFTGGCEYRPGLLMMGVAF